MLGLVQGSQYQLGMLFEVLLNIQNKNNDEKGIIQSYAITRSDIEKIVKGFESYTDEGNASFIDSLVIK